MSTQEPTPMGRGFSWSAEEDRRMTELLKQKLPKADVAAILDKEFRTGRSVGAVTRRLMALGHKVKKRASRAPVSRWDDVQRKRAFDLLASGLSHTETAEHLNAEFGTNRTGKGVSLYMDKHREELEKAAKRRRKSPVAEQLVVAGVRLPAMPKAVPAKPVTTETLVRVPVGRTLSVVYPMGKIQVLLEGELPIATIRSLSEVLVHAAIS